VWGGEKARESGEECVCAREKESESGSDVERMSDREIQRERK